MTKRSNKDGTVNDDVVYQQNPGVLNANPPNENVAEGRDQPRVPAAMFYYPGYNMPEGWHPAHETQMGVWGPLDAEDEAEMDAAKMNERGRQERQEWVWKNQKENEALLAPVTDEATPRTSQNHKKGQATATA